MGLTIYIHTYLYILYRGEELGDINLRGVAISSRRGSSSNSSSSISSGSGGFRMASSGLGSGFSKSGMQGRYGNHNIHNTSNSTSNSR